MTSSQPVLNSEISYSTEYVSSTQTLSNKLNHLLATTKVNSQSNLLTENKKPSITKVTSTKLQLPNTQHKLTTETETTNKSPTAIPVTESTVSKNFNINLTFFDLLPFRTNNNDDKRFNDNIVNYYMNMISNGLFNTRLKINVNIFSSIDFVRFLTCNNSVIKHHKFNIFKYDYILAPICLNSHWSLIKIFTRTKKVRHFDSSSKLKSYNERAQRIYKFIENIIRIDLAELNIKFVPSEWVFRLATNVPQQSNNYDCGPFICLYSKILSYDMKINPSQFTNDYISNYRKRILIEITDSSLSDFDFKFIHPKD
jgi:Ulp1 family protease